MANEFDMGNILTKMDATQFNALVAAIRSGGGGGGGEGSVVSWEQLVTSGEHIANIDIDGVSTEVYAPSTIKTHTYISDGLVPTNCTITTGGYFMDNDIVFINIRLSTQNYAQPIISGFPKSFFTLPISIFNGNRADQLRGTAYINNQGVLTVRQDNYAPNEIIVLSGSYLIGGE